jgi:hypothetical protein
MRLITYRIAELAIGLGAKSSGSKHLIEQK